VKSTQGWKGEKETNAGFNLTDKRPEEQERDSHLIMIPAFSQPFGEFRDILVLIEQLQTWFVL